MDSGGVAGFVVWQGSCLGYVLEDPRLTTVC
jgi:hypothetical protein